MDFTFETKELRDLCESADLATQKLGEMTARNLRRVLSELSAARTMRVYSNLTAISPNEPDRTFKVPLSDEVTLIARQGHRRPPLDADGELNLAEVRRVKIVELRGIE